MTKMQAAIEDT